MLALAPSHSVHRERVMNLLWPNLHPRAAANNLRYALYKNRLCEGCLADVVPPDDYVEAFRVINYKSFADSKDIYFKPGFNVHLL